MTPLLFPILLAAIAAAVVLQNAVAMHVAQGESISLTEILAGNYTLGLWTAGPNSNVPGKADLEGNYTDMTGSGYAAKTLTGGIIASPSAGWTLSGSNPTVGTYNIVQVFTMSAATAPILGYHLKRASDGKLRHVYKFDTPWQAAQANDHLDLTIKITQG